MAHYDDFDYPAYWTHRNYEHQSEEIALKAFLDIIGKKENLIDIGCGFGRIVPIYKNSAKKITLSDPSQSLLDIAKKNLGTKNITYVHSEVKDLPKKLKNKKYETLLFIRVMHHIISPDEAIQILSSLSAKRGYLIIEFANKINAKAIFKNITKGNFTFLMDIFPIDLRSKRNKQTGSISFHNYHPDSILELLKKHNLKTIQIRSVSNIRSQFIKKHIPISILLWVEKALQRALGKIYFGPSIFILAKKT
jgi:ubiquinone/menaquinone biosynthesis C-methylase UbiE